MSCLALIFIVVVCLGWFLVVPFLRFLRAVRALRAARMGRVVSSAVRTSRTAGRRLSPRPTELSSTPATKPTPPTTDGA